MIVRALALTASSLFPSIALAAGLTIGVVAPQSGPYEILGKQVLDGARVQIEAAGNKMLVIDESCKDGSGEEIAAQAISAGASATIGYLCSQSLWDALPALKEAGIPAITLSVRSPILFEDSLKQGWPLFSLAPPMKAQEDAIANTIRTEWSGKPFAILDDGTIHSRELAAHVRQDLEEKGLTAQFADTFRPTVENQIRMVRRLKKAGISHVFISGDRNDVAIFARDANADGINLTILGGESLLAADDGVPLSDGVLAIIPAPWRSRPEASTIVNALQEVGITVEGYVLPAHAAAQIADKAAELAQADNKSITDILQSQTFATANGSVSFDADHIRNSQPYELFEWRTGAFHKIAPSPVDIN